MTTKVMPTKRGGWTASEVFDKRIEACSILQHTPKISSTKLAKEIGVSVSSISNWRKAGDLSPSGPYWFFKRGSEMTTKVMPIIREGQPAEELKRWIAERVEEDLQSVDGVELFSHKRFSTRSEAVHYINTYWDGTARFKLTREYPVR